MGPACSFLMLRQRPPPIRSLTLPGMVLDKRHRGVDDTDGVGGPETSNADVPPPRKKGKGKVAATIGVSEAGESPNRTHQQPATGTLTSFDKKSKGGGTRAEGLALPIAQGVYYWFMQCPAGVDGNDCAGKATWVGGSAERATWHHTNKHGAAAADLQRRRQQVRSGRQKALLHPEEA